MAKGKNPRKEKEVHNMKLLNKSFLKILGRKPIKVFDSLKNS